MQPKVIISLLGLYLIVQSVAEIISMLALAFTPGIFASSVAQGFQHPRVVFGLGESAGIIALGLGLIIWRSTICRMLNIEEARSDIDVNALGPVLFQLLALYLIVSNLPGIIYMLWGLGTAEVDIARKAGFATMLYQGKLNSVIIVLAATAMLFGSRWLFRRLWPETKAASRAQ